MTVPLPIAGENQLKLAEFVSACGVARLVLTSGMYPHVQEHVFQAAGWDVLRADVIAVWNETYVRSATLMYASIAGQKPCWFEVSYFTTGPTDVSMPTYLAPERDAALALSPVAHVWGLAHPPRRLEGGGLAEFIDRWMGWFAQAIDGVLARPQQLPEQ